MSVYANAILLSKEELEMSKRENIELFEKERRLQLKVKSLQNSLKNVKEEVLSLLLLRLTMLSVFTSSFFLS